MTVRTTRLGPGKRLKRNERRDSGQQLMQTERGKAFTEKGATVHPYETPKMFIQRGERPHMPMTERTKRPAKRKHSKT